MSNSPTKESIPNWKLDPPSSIPIQDPPSPRSHRTLRRLQSAHSLGQANNQPSLISQQHRQALQRTLSPATNPTVPNRGRSNSDATNMTLPNPGSAGRRPVSVKRPIAADALSLDRLIRDGPPDGDLLGALESSRLKILDQGIKSDTDGMVGTGTSNQGRFANKYPVISAHICMAHITQCTNNRDRFLPRPHPSRRVPGVLQN